jgi:hypothetical protein
MNAHDSAAILNRPASTEQLAAEIRRLRGTGLTARDISEALRLPLPEILEALREPP